jgi:hypothetical protein
VTLLVFQGCCVISCERKGCCNSVNESYFNYHPSRWLCERIDLCRCEDEEEDHISRNGMEDIVSNTVRVLWRSGTESSTY